MTNAARAIVDQINAHMNPGTDVEVPECFGTPRDSFHRTLDRSLEKNPHNDWGIESDALGDLRAIQDKINADAKRLARITAAPALFDDSWEHNTVARRLLPEYDDSYLQDSSFVDLGHALPEFPIRFIAGIDPGDVDQDMLLARNEVMWQVPATVTFEARNVAIETLELVFGMALIPLCDRKIPAEGQE